MRWRAFLCFLLLSLPLVVRPALAQLPTSVTLQSAASTGTGADLPVSGLSMVAVSLIGTAGADRVVAWQVSQDGTNFGSVSCRNVSTLAVATSITASGTTLFQVTCPVAGMQTFRTSVSGGSTGTVTVKAMALPQVSLFPLLCSVAEGCTGIASYAVGDLLYADTTTSLAKLAIGASGAFLTTNGTIPAWAVNVAINTTTIHVQNQLNAADTTDTHAVIYGTSSAGGAYPFLTAGNLILQSRPSGANRDVLLVTGTSQTIQGGAYGGGGMFVGSTAPTTGLVGGLTLKGVTFANLGTPDNGTITLCTDCDAPTLVDSTCTHVAGQLGALAVRVNGVWKCIS